MKYRDPAEDPVVQALNRGVQRLRQMEAEKTGTVSTSEKRELGPKSLRADIDEPNIEEQV